MTDRIQKTIIAKFVQLANQPVATETELTELTEAIARLYSERKLVQTDLYRQKIELITSALNKAINEVKRKRTKKEVNLEVHKDFIAVLLDDLDGVDYSKSDLASLSDYESNDLSNVNADTVEQALKHLVVIKRRLSSEADLEKFLSEQLAYLYGRDRIHRQYSVGGFLALKTDIDIGNGQVGLELKIAEKLNASEMQRIIGQVLYYKKRFYHDNLIVCIASKSPITSSLRELIEFIEELDIKVVFIQAITV